MKVNSIKLNQINQKLKENNYSSEPGNMAQVSFEGLQASRAAKIPAKKLALALAAGLSVLMPTVSYAQESQKTGIVQSQQTPSIIDASNTLSALVDPNVDKNRVSFWNANNSKQINLADFIGSSLIDYYDSKNDDAPLVDVKDLSVLSQKFTKQTGIKVEGSSDVVASLYSNYQSIMKDNQVSAKNAVFSYSAYEISNYAYFLESAVNSFVLEKNSFPTPTPENIKLLKSKADSIKDSEQKQYSDSNILLPKDTSKISMILIKRILGSKINDYIQKNPGEGIKNFPFDAKNGLEYYIAWSKDYKQPNLTLQYETAEELAQKQLIKDKKQEIVNLKSNIESDQRKIDGNKPQITSLSSTISYSESNYSVAQTAADQMKQSIDMLNSSGSFALANSYMSLYIWGLNQLADLDTKIKSLKSQKTGLEGENSSIQVEIQQLQQKIRNIETEFPAVKMDDMKTKLSNQLSMFTKKQLFRFAKPVESQPAAAPNVQQSAPKGTQGTQNGSSAGVSGSKTPTDGNKNVELSSRIDELKYKRQSLIIELGNIEMQINSNSNSLSSKSSSLLTYQELKRSSESTLQSLERSYNMSSTSPLNKTLLGNQIAEYRNSINNYDSKINSLIFEIQNLNSNISSLNQVKANLQSQISILESQISQLKN